MDDGTLRVGGKPGSRIVEKVFARAEDVGLPLPIGGDDGSVLDDFGHEHETPASDYCRRLLLYSIHRGHLLPRDQHLPSHE